MTPASKPTNSAAAATPITSPAPSELDAGADGGLFCVVPNCRSVSAGISAGTGATTVAAFGSTNSSGRTFTGPAVCGPEVRMPGTGSVGGVSGAESRAVSGALVTSMSGAARGDSRPASRRSKPKASRSESVSSLAV